MKYLHLDTSIINLENVIFVRELTDDENNELSTNQKSVQVVATDGTETYLPLPDNKKLRDLDVSE